MRIFISWSKERGLALARALNEFVPNVLQDVRPFFSPDIEKGTQWAYEIAKALEECVFGIICVTPESIAEPWLNFEAGAVASMLSKRMSPIIVGLSKSDITPPLSNYTLTDTGEQDVRRLMSDLNSKLERPLSDERFKTAFAVHWPALAEELLKIENMSPEASKSSPRSLENKVDELLALARQQSADQLAGLLQAQPLDALDRLSLYRPEELNSLAEREMYVARELARGKSMAAIAEGFGVSPQRIRSIAERTARKLSVKGIRGLRNYMLELVERQRDGALYADDVEDALADLLIDPTTPQS